MTVNPTVTPSVSISTLTNPICSGSSATFTAVPTNGGASPSYQWKKNGTNVGTNSTTYTDNALANGDVITCVLTSNASCAILTSATSNPVAITVNSVLTPTVSIADIAFWFCMFRNIRNIYSNSIKDRRGNR